MKQNFCLTKIFATAFFISSSIALVSQSAKAESIRESLFSAWVSNPQLQAARQSYLSAGTDVQSAFAEWLPQASLQLEYGITQNSSRNYMGNPRALGERSNSTTNPWSASVVINQNIFRGGQIIANVSSSRSNEAAVFGELLVTEQNILLGVVRAYYSLLRDSAVVRLNRNNVSVFGKRLAETRNRFRVGEGTRTLTAFAEARLSAAQTQLAAAEATYVASRSAFERIIGRKPTGALSFAKLPRLPKKFKEAQSRARRSHPLLIAARERYNTATTAQVAAYGLFLPQVSVEGSYTQGQELSPNNKDTTNLSIKGRLQMPIFNGGRNFATVRKARIEASRFRFNLQDRMREVDEAVANAWQNLKTARAQIRSSRQQVKANRIALNGIRQQQSLGTSTFLDSLDAEQDYLNAQVALETARQDEQVAAYALLAASGGLTGKLLNLKKVK